MTSKYSPIIYDYLKKYQEDPTSRVFAPLAEAYRKAGLIDEAIEIAREGLQIHPNFVGGRVALARALFDNKQYEKVVDELSPVVQNVPDNLVAQRLLAESYLMLGRADEALFAFKMLLYYAPQDAETAKLVTELESRAYEKGQMVLKTPDPEPAFDVKAAAQVVADDPGIRRARLVKQVEGLQALLMKVERYKATL